jgi:septal ring factor EnvC (AmiA/AmiB activator)
MSVKFDDQGRLLQAGLKRESSTALGLANAAGSGADQLSSLLKELKNKPLTDAKFDTELAKAKKALQDAEEDLVDTPGELAKTELELQETLQKIDTIKRAMSPDRSKELAQQIAIAKLAADLADQLKRQVTDPNADLAAVASYEQARTTVINGKISSAEAELRLLNAQRALDAAKVAP